MRKFGVFDIDGTLVRWQLYHAVVDELIRLEFLDAAEFENVKIARLEWKKRSDKATFRDYESALVQAFHQAITHISPNQLNEAIENAFEQYKDQVYTYTRSLIAQLKKEGYLLFAISGSQSEIVDKIADYYGFESALGTEYEIVGDEFTGKNVFHAQNKAIALRHLIEKFSLDISGSYAVGDSKSDISMLEMVENPIAFNPEDELLKHAKKHGWKVVVERKNVIYQLESHDGSYVLA